MNGYPVSMSFFNSYSGEILNTSFLYLLINRLLIQIFASILADLAKYEIGKLLGSGSFGQVVAATRKSDDKPVCVSFI